MPLERDDPVLAVVAPPRIARFRELAGLRDDEVITADFSGWCKLVLLTDELAVLFARDHHQVEALRREVDGLRVVAAAGLPEVPEIVAEWDDRALSAYPVVALRRLRGTMLDEVVVGVSHDVLGGVLEHAARLAARWHVLDPGTIADRGPRSSTEHALVDDLLAAGEWVPTPDDVATRVGRQLELDEQQRSRLADALGRARALEHVLVHGDLHEGQLLVDDDMRITGVLDWQTARVNHPFTEFDLGEWGTGAWRAHRTAFPDLRRRMWTAYAAERQLDPLLTDDFEIFWSVVCALRWPNSVYVGSAVTGSLEEAMANVHAALSL